jgi:CheY-like chemotaxis protein
MVEELIDRPTIMVVDDDDQVRNLLAELLENCGYRAKVAANGLSSPWCKWSSLRFAAAVNR